MARFNLYPCIMQRNGNTAKISVLSSSVASLVSTLEVWSRAHSGETKFTTDGSAKPVPVPMEKARKMIFVAKPVRYYPRVEA